MSKQPKNSYPPDWPGFAAALRDLMDWQAAQKLPLALVGGVAVGVYSRPRATKDIDVTWVTQIAPDALLPSLAAHHLVPAFAESIELAVNSGVLPLVHTPSGAIIDIIFALFPYQQQMVARAVPIEVMDRVVPVVQLEDLCVLKLFAGRPQDMVDVQSLARGNPKLDRAAVLEQIRLFAEMIEEPQIYENARNLLMPGSGSDF